MKSFVLLYDRACNACAGAADTASQVFGDDITTRGLLDPWVIDALASSGLEPPTGPALLSVDDSGAAALTTGLRMRFQLARLLGPARSRKALRLLAAEAKARGARAASASTNERGWDLSRRRLIGLIGIGSGAAVIGLPQAATAVSAAPSPELIERSMALPAIQKAIADHGSIVADSFLEVNESGEHVLMMRHRSGAVTFLDASTKSDPVINTVIPSTDGKARTLTFVHTASGEVVGDLTQAAAGAAVVGTPTASGPSAEVSFVRKACFIACMAGQTSERCFQTCFNCFVNGTLLDCSYATICGGVQFQRCWKQC